MEIAAVELRTYVNLIIVFTLCGLWHGANYTFLVWGLFHGAILIIERILKQRFNVQPSGLAGWAMTLFLVMISWVFFRADNVTAAVGHLQTMFGLNGAAGSQFTVFFYLTPDKIAFLALGLFFSLAPLRFPDWRTSSLVQQGLLSTGSLACLAYSLTLIAANGF